MKRLLQYAAVVALAPALPEAAQAQAVVASNPASLVTELRAAGYRAELAKDTEGAPLINGSLLDVPFQIYFLDCNKSANCANVQFFAGYRYRAKVTQAWINDWNAKCRYVRAYLTNEGEARLKMDVILRNAGMSPALFQDYLDRWTVEWTLFDVEINKQ